MPEIENPSGVNEHSILILNRYYEEASPEPDEPRTRQARNHDIEYTLIFQVPTI